MDNEDEPPRLHPGLSLSCSPAPDDESLRAAFPVFTSPPPSPTMPASPRLELEPAEIVALAAAHAKDFDASIVQGGSVPGPLPRVSSQGSLDSGLGSRRPSMTLDVERARTFSVDVSDFREASPSPTGFFDETPPPTPIPAGATLLMSPRGELFSPSGPRGADVDRALSKASAYAETSADRAKEADEVNALLKTAKSPLRYVRAPPPRPPGCVDKLTGAAALPELRRDLEDAQREADAALLARAALASGLETCSGGRTAAWEDADSARRELLEAQAEAAKAVAATLAAEAAAAALKERLQRTGEALRDTTAMLEAQAAVAAAAAASRERELTATASEARLEAQSHWESRMAAEITRRRAAHEKLAAILGNIRVVCRIRPVVVAGAAGEGSACVWPSALPGEVMVADKENAYRHEYGAQSFDFGEILGPSATSEEVYETVAPQVLSVLDGVDAVVMAYGQTGSGKTHTQLGTVEEPGVVFRAADELFAEAQRRNDSANELYAFEVKMLEIYNEKIVDLLAAVAEPGADEPAALKVGTGADGRVGVVGQTAKACGTAEALRAAITAGVARRAVRAHDTNAASSRSHLVVSVGAECAGKHQGVLHLVDLAGSERVDRTGVTGDAMQEAKMINKSLSALGDVVGALSKEASGHIPYRNSKLTHLLQDALKAGGGARVGMIVCASPVQSDVPESVCSLRFGARCASVKLGMATRRAVDEEEKRSFS